MFAAWAVAGFVSTVVFGAPSASAAGAPAAASAPPDALAAVAAPTPTLVTVPSLDRPGGTALALPGHWFTVTPATGPAAPPRPALVLLHGCGGAVTASGSLQARMNEYAALLLAEGWQVLVLDSFSPRGERQICTQRIGTRLITQQQRRRDVLGALAWLAARPEVDPQRLALLGWSNGGSAVLAATNSRQTEVAAAPVRPRVAVAFYPGCETELQRGYKPSAALLMLVGELDDWTPAAPCQALAAAAAPPAAAAASAAGPAAITAPAPAAAAAPPPVQLALQPGAYHGFDGTAPVRLRSDVPNGVHPGAGVHVGGQPEARARSRLQLLAFLRDQLR